MKKINFKNKYVCAFIVYIAFACVTMFELFHLNVLPMKYTMVISLLVIVITALLGLAYYKKKLLKTSTCISIVLCVAMIFANVIMLKSDGFIGKITKPTNEKAKVSLIVMKEDTASSLQDIKDESIGMSETGQTTYVYNAIDEINKELQSSMNLKKYQSPKSMVDDLYNSEVRVILIDHSMLSSIEDDFADFNEKTKIIKSWEYDVAQSDISKNVDVVKEPFNIYISGIDTYGEINTVARSDVNMIVSVNPNTKQILMTSIPRDYYIPQTCQANQTDKLTHTGYWGVGCTTSTIENYFGIDINYYVRINFSSLENIVDTLGGITVENPRDFTGSGIFFKAGSIQLNGKEALAFSRERHAFAEGDFERGRDQMRVLTGIINKITSPSIITNYMGILDAVGNTFQTNLSEGELKSLINMQLDDMASWNIEQVSVAGERGYDWSPANGDSTNIVYPVEESVENAKNMIQAFIAK